MSEVYAFDADGPTLDDGRPVPSRPATAEDHHDHRHWPYIQGDCLICDDIAARDALAAEDAEATEEVAAEMAAEAAARVAPGEALGEASTANEPRAAKQRTPLGVRPAP